MAKRKPTLRINNPKNTTVFYKNHIKDLNQRLVWWGELEEQHNTESFSINTLNAVKSFQSKKGLVDDGVVGIKTWGEITKPSQETTLSDVEKVDIITQCGENGCMIEPPKHEDLSAGFTITKYWEQLRLVAYPDPGTGGKPITIGWGSTVDIDGKPFQLGRKITKQYADDLFRIKVAEVFLPKLRQLPYWYEMNSNQQSALFSFMYNVGENFYGAKGYDTITRVLKNKEWSMVPKAFMLYVNPGSNVEKGLRNRRQQEGQLWSRPI